MAKSLPSRSLNTSLKSLYFSSVGSTGVPSTFRKLSTKDLDSPEGFTLSVTPPLSCWVTVLNTPSAIEYFFQKVTSLMLERSFELNSSEKASSILVAFGLVAVICKVSPTGNKYWSPQFITSLKNSSELSSVAKSVPLWYFSHEPSYKATRIARIMAVSLLTRNPLYLLRECKLARASGINPIAAFKSFRIKRAASARFVAGICKPPNVALPSQKSSIMGILPKRVSR